MTPPTYRPILLTKDGELDAVSELPGDTTEFFEPIFAIHPQTTSSVADHVAAGRAIGRLGAAVIA